MTDQIPLVHRPMRACANGPNDYTRINYFLDAKGVLWKGPMCPGDNLHWASLTLINSTVGASWTVSRSAPDAGWAEITPYQAAEHGERMAEQALRDEEEQARCKAIGEGAFLVDFQGNRTCPNCSRKLTPPCGPHYRRSEKGVPIYECIREWWKY